MGKIVIQLRAINTKIQIPRENTCKMLTDALNFAKLCKILETSYRKLTKNQSAQNATPVEENRLSAQNATPVEETSRGLSECDTCRRKVT